MSIYKIPENINYALKMLHDAGFEAYVVGGSVRDTLLGKKPHDWDITTSATPYQIKNVFSSYRQIDIGLQHGTVAILIDKETVEITTFRVDGKYTDGRRPDKVFFTTSIIEDLSRRDFTINACAITDTLIIDPFGGQEDIKNHLIRCVGNPSLRFKEDALRILRAIRFASVLNFDVEEKTAQAIFDCKSLLANVSQERITDEFRKTLLGCNVKNTLSWFSDVIAFIVPEIKDLIRFQGDSKYSGFDLYEHTLKAVEAVESDVILRTCMFLYNVEKPQFYLYQGSAAEYFEGSARMAEYILRRMRFSSKEIAAITELIRYSGTDIEPESKSVKKALSIMGEVQFRRLLKVKRADLSVQTSSISKLKDLDTVEIIFNDLISRNACFTLRDLAVNGNDLINIGVSKGKQIGIILNKLFDMVLNDEIKNNKDTLLQYVISTYF